jgi:16S rRNA C1402 (ribose-2'-O) methylase RsmI
MAAFFEPACDSFIEEAGHEFQVVHGSEAIRGKFSLSGCAGYAGHFNGYHDAEEQQNENAESQDDALP